MTFFSQIIGIYIYFFFNFSQQRFLLLEFSCILANTKKFYFSIALKLLHSLPLSHQICKSMEYSASVPLDKILSCNESYSLNWWWWLEIYLSQLFTNSLHSSFILSSSSGIHGLLNIWGQFHQKGVQLQCTKVSFKL